MELIVYLFWFWLPVWILVSSVIILMICQRLFNLDLTIFADEKKPWYYIKILYIAVAVSFWLTDVDRLSFWQSLFQMCYKGLFITIAFLILKYIYERYYITDRQIANKYIKYAAFTIFLAISSYIYGNDIGYKSGWENAISSIREKSGNQVYSKKEMSNAWEDGWNNAISWLINNSPSEVLYYGNFHINLENCYRNSYYKNNSDKDRSGVDLDEVTCQYE